MQRTKATSPTQYHAGKAVVSLQEEQLPIPPTIPNTEVSPTARGKLRMKSSEALPRKLPLYGTEGGRPQALRELSKMMEVLVVSNYEIAGSSMRKKAQTTIR